MSAQLCHLGGEFGARSLERLGELYITSCEPACIAQMTQCAADTGSVSGEVYRSARRNGKMASRQSDRYQ